SWSHKTVASSISKVTINHPGSLSSTKRMVYASPFAHRYLAFFNFSHANSESAKQTVCFVESKTPRFHRASVYSARRRGYDSSYTVHRSSNVSPCIPGAITYQVQVPSLLVISPHQACSFTGSTACRNA